jgi:hypothetical protein
VAELVLQIDRKDQLRKIRLRLPHPTKQPMQRVTLNGAAWKSFNVEDEIVELQPGEGRHRIVVHY